MANINDDLAAALEAAQREFETLGKVTDATAARLKVAQTAVDQFKEKMNLAANASSALYRTFTSYNRAVTDGIKGYKDLADTTDNLATSIEALSAALAFVLPIGRVAKIVTAGLGLLAGELVRTSKAVGEQLDGLRSGFDELAQIGATTAGGLTDMFEAMQKAGLSVKDFPGFAKVLAENGQLLAQFGGTVITGRNAVLDLTKDLRPMQDELQNFGIRIEQIGEASLGFIKNQKLMSMGTNANLNMGAQAMMKYVQELDTLAKLTGINRKEQEKIMEDAMSRASFAATIDQMIAEGRTEEAQAIQQAQMYFARLGPESLRGFQDSISEFMGTSDEANNLYLASNGAHADYIAKLKDGTLKTEKQIAEGAQGVYRALTETGETIGRNAAMLNTNFGTVYTEIRKAKPYATASVDQLIAMAEEEQKKRDEALKNSNKEMIEGNKRMLENQKVIDSQVSNYQAMIGKTTGALGSLTDAATRAAEAMGMISTGKSKGGAPAAGGGGAAAPSSANVPKNVVPGTTPGVSPLTGRPIPGQTTGASAGQATQMAAIKSLISSVESFGDYNIMVGQSKGGAKQNLTAMTLDELMEFQAQYGRGGAAGKYQVQPDTLKDAMRALGLSGRDKFDESTQEKIGEWLISTRGGYNEFLKGSQDQASKERLLRKLSGTWAGLPAGPDNRSYYAGVGNNKAGIDWTDALQKFAEGGRLGGGKYGIAGEAGPELISGPANITPMNDLMGAFKDLLNAMATSTSILERIDRNTAASSDSSDRMLRLAQN